MAYSWVGRYDEAIAAYKKALQRAPNDIITHIELTKTYSWAGRMEEARTQAREVLEDQSQVLPRAGCKSIAL